MSRFSFSLSRRARFDPSAADRPLEVDDSVIRDRLNRSMRRRISDDLAALIERACLSGHTATAEKLLLVLQDLFEQEKREFPNGRPPNERLLTDSVEKVAAAKSRDRAR